MQAILPLFLVGGNARDLDLLTTNRAVYGLDVIGAGLADDSSSAMREDLQTTASSVVSITEWDQSISLT